MSTYTVDLESGKEVTFQEFTMKCARAFGPLIEMREEPFDAPIPDEFHPSNYNLNEIKKAKECLAEIERWSNARAERKAKNAFDKEVRSFKKNGEKKREDRTSVHRHA